MRTSYTNLEPNLENVIFRWTSTSVQLRELYIHRIEAAARKPPPGQRDKSEIAAVYWAHLSFCANRLTQRWPGRSYKIPRARTVKLESSRRRRGLSQTKLLGLCGRLSLRDMVFV